MKKNDTDTSPAVHSRITAVAANPGMAGSRSAGLGGRLPAWHPSQAREVPRAISPR